MRSVVISEPAAPGVILIEERSEVAEHDRETFQVYCGLLTRFAAPWKAAVETSDSIFHSIGAHFAKHLSRVTGIERIFARRDDDFLRVWIVIPEMDLAKEDEIYEAQLAFMDKFPDTKFNLCVIFRQGKDPRTINPSGARLVYPLP